MKKDLISMVINKLFYPFILCCCLFLTTQSYAKEYPEPETMTVEEAYQLGDLLVDQYKIKQGQPYLKYAADRGHADAALAYSRSLSTNIMVQTPQEHEYAIKAAELGSEDAKFKLSSSRNIYGDRELFRIPLIKELKSRAEQGDANAMNMLYFLCSDVSKSEYWFNKAVEHGNANAQFSLANRYEAGEGWFFIPGNRDKEIKRLYKASAEQGNLSGMEGYASVLFKEGKKKEALDIWIKSANTGSAGAITFIAGRYLHSLPQITYPEKNEVLGAAYLKIYFDSMGNDKNNSLYDARKNDYIDLMNRLTDEQKKQVNQFADEFLNKHTVRVIN
ncbi:tetratricopeptide repeat protein [Photobacterium kishitanii]|uniref:tetratricopeptide repeat protein n=1 Tax=Photobacterium kishitanii TaxID=318456 RepID=UPI0011B29AB0|nr:sel1 repeat family protein [Photobacterium kishitanii]